jgi:hypothetical protein
MRAGARGENDRISEGAIMDATPPPELANHEERITNLENAVTNLACELKTLKAHIDTRFMEQRANFDAQLHEAVEKLNARMDSQTYLIIGMQVAVFLALVALVASALVVLAADA